MLNSHLSYKIILQQRVRAHHPPKPKRWSIHTSTHTTKKAKGPHKCLKKCKREMATILSLMNLCLTKKRPMRMMFIRAQMPINWQIRHILTARIFIKRARTAIRAKCRNIMKIEISSISRIIESKMFKMILCRIFLRVHKGRIKDRKEITQEGTSDLWLLSSLSRVNSKTGRIWNVKHMQRLSAGKR